MKVLDVSEELYEAVLAHDNKFDGEYYIGVVSTGIVCFPSCRSRTPKKANIRVFSTLEDALGAGFRPCKRCKPENPYRRSPDSEIVHKVIEILKTEFQTSITLKTLSQALSISPYHLQRTFKRSMGISPAIQLRRIRMDEAQRLLRLTERPIGDVAVDIGFQSQSHFSSTFQREFGVTPQEYRKSMASEEKKVSDSISR